MKVLITGAGGNLGRVLAPALGNAGHEPVLMDSRDIKSPFASIKGDVTVKEDVFRAAEGVDAVVHAAALHGIHLSKYATDDFWKLNVEGTYHVYEAAAAHGIKKVLLCSTMGVYGESAREVENRVPVVTEDLPLLPGDFYGYSKKVNEETAHYYSRIHGIQTIAYRLGMFVPEDFLRYGFRLLKGGVDDRDVAHAFLLGLHNNVISFDSFNIMADVPFPLEIFARLREEPVNLIEEYYPGISGMVQKRGADISDLLSMWGYTYWSIEKAKSGLGYQPQYNFTQFYKAFREGDETHYPYANLPWWGI